MDCTIKLVNLSDFPKLSKPSLYFIHKRKNERLVIDSRFDDYDKLIGYLQSKNLLTE